MQNVCKSKHSKNPIGSPATPRVTNNRSWRRARGAPSQSTRAGGGDWPGGRAVPEAAPGRSLGGARDAPSWPVAGLDLSLSPPGAAAAPLVVPRLQKGPTNSSPGQSVLGRAAVRTSWWCLTGIRPPRSCEQLSPLPGAAVPRGLWPPQVAEPGITPLTPRLRARVGRARSLSLGARWGSPSSALRARCPCGTS